MLCWFLALIVTGGLIYGGYRFMLWRGAAMIAREEAERAAAAAERKRKRIAAGQEEPGDRSMP